MVRDITIAHVGRFRIYYYAAGPGETVVDPGPYWMADTVSGGWEVLHPHTKPRPTKEEKELTKLALEMFLPLSEEP